MYLPISPIFNPHATTSALVCNQGWRLRRKGKKSASTSWWWLQAGSTKTCSCRFSNIKTEIARKPASFFCFLHTFFFHGTGLCCLLLWLAVQASFLKVAFELGFDPWTLIERSAEWVRKNRNHNARKKSPRGSQGKPRQVKSSELGNYTQ